MSAAPQYASTPRLAVQTISTANSNRDGTGTIGTVISAAGAIGTRIRRIEIQATGTVTAGMVRLYLHDGTTAHLFKEVQVVAATPSATDLAFTANYSENDTPGELPLTLPVSWSIRASTEKAETFKIIIEGADL